MDEVQKWMSRPQDEAVVRYRVARGEVPILDISEAPLQTGRGSARSRGVKKKPAGSVKKNQRTATKNQRGVVLHRQYIR